MKKEGRRDEQHNVAFREEIVKSDWLTWCWRTAKKSDSKKIIILIITDLLTLKPNQSSHLISSHLPLID